MAKSKSFGLFGYIFAQIFHFCGPTSLRQLLFLQFIMIVSLFYGAFLLASYVGLWPSSGKLQHNRLDMLPFFPTIMGDASLITWQHAVNSKADLEKAVSSDVLFIESDVISVPSGNNPILYMAHPPATTSDLTLEDWLSGLSSVRKGLKLDFKNDDAVRPGMALLASYDHLFPVIVNADILPGPNMADDKTVPINPLHFTNAVAEHKAHPWILSVGWTTKFIKPSGGHGYSWQHVFQMYSHLTEMQHKHFPRSSKFPLTVTFPVRSSLLGLNSLPKLMWLTALFPAASLTVFTGRGDTHHGVDELLLYRRVFPLGRLLVDLPYLSASDRAVYTEGVNSPTQRSENFGEHDYFSPREWSWSTSRGGWALGSQGGLMFSGANTTVASHKSIRIQTGQTLTLTLRLYFWTAEGSATPPQCTVKIYPRGPSIHFTLTSKSDGSSWITSSQHSSPNGLRITTTSDVVASFSLTIVDRGAAKPITLEVAPLDQYDTQEVVQSGKTASVELSPQLADGTGSRREDGTTVQPMVALSCGSNRSHGVLDQLNYRVE